MNEAREVNFDGLVGPTHGYAGLSYGNIAAQRWKGTVSNPRAAALEGLAKMKLLADLGVMQCVLPPQDRPDISALRQLGFTGTDTQVIQSAWKTDPVLVAACYSASSMWAANAATVSPSADTADGKVHITPANLVSEFHRSLESASTAATLRAILTDPRFFIHHAPLPATSQLSDEGAANHLRLAAEHGAPGLEVFVYGRSAFDPVRPRPVRFPARQVMEASAAIARLHGLSRTLFLQQNPSAIDAGAFHDDVVAVANENVLICHAAAFADPGAMDQIQRQFAGDLFIYLASEAELPLREAIETYVFNSQVVTLPDGTMVIVAPAECEGPIVARRFIDRIVQSGGPVKHVHFVHVRQSMQNGGGPACLRLRVVLTAAQQAAINPSVILTPNLYEDLIAWVNRRYRDRLAPADLADPKLIDESRAALAEVRGILGLP